MTTTEVMTNEEIKTSEHDLIRGEFSPEDAREIINYLISKKINFHETRNFSSEIRFGEVDHNSIKRAKELEQSRKSINTLIQQAEGEGKSLRISSNISIEII